MNAYQHNLKILRDDYAADQYAKELAEEAGMAKGIAKGIQLERTKAEANKKAIALNLKNKGISVDIISDSMGLSISEIEAL